MRRKWPHQQFEFAVLAVGKMQIAHQAASAHIACIEKPMDRVAVAPRQTRKRRADLRLRT